MKEIINLIIADDHPVYRKGLALCIGSLEHFQTNIWLAANGLEVLSIVESNEIDVVLMDIAMPGMNGIDATRQITDKHCLIKVIALSFYADRQSVIKMIRAGAAGYLTKNSDVSIIMKAINDVMEGKKFYSDDIINYLLMDMGDQHFLQNGFKTLEHVTKREAEIIRLIALGFTSNEIGKELFISQKTVESHRSHIFNKLKIKHLTDLIYFAMDKGLISQESALKRLS